ncbi:MAG TPA: hypothetical protein PLS53_02585 [Thermoanaerobaculaceae bacterium]|nr:hypothetical protein [Thermoanaerobaculaceae bacterium]HPS77019.1 hypothetical protein [Thermoanaerobaculaceae bacterium]
MRRNMSVVCAVLALAAALVGCDKEVKPDKPGAFVVAGKKLIDWPPVAMQDEFTPEGFMISYFLEDPTATVRWRDSYFIFNGDYKPFKLRQFVKSEGRWVEDSSRPVGDDVLQVGPLKGETKMFKGKLLKEMKTGVYVLDVKLGNGQQQSFAFRIP